MQSKRAKKPRPRQVYSTKTWLTNSLGEKGQDPLAGFSGFVLRLVSACFCCRKLRLYK